MFYIVSILMAPGVIFHELAHAVSCVLSRVKIFKIKLFGFGDPAGFVEHAVPESFFQSLVISSGPLIFNSLLALLAFSRVVISFSVESIICLWLGVVIALHAIPSMGDVEALFRSAKRTLRKNILIIFCFPLVGVLYGLNFFKKIHIHVVYAALLFWLGSVYLKM